MKLKSYSIAALHEAIKDGYRLFELDTGDSGEDDVLYGASYDAVHADVVCHHDLDEWPAGWTLREVQPSEVFPS